MGRITQTQKMIVEQFPDQKDWIEPLLNTYNQFIIDAVRTINGQLEFGANVQGQEHEYNFIYQSHATTFPQEFTWNFSVRPRPLTVVAASENNPANNNVFSSIMVNVSWDYSAKNTVRILDVVKMSGNTAAIADLTANNKYKILVRVS